MTPSGNFGPRVSRRTFLTATSVGIGGLALTACSTTPSTTPGTTAASVEQSAILAAEEADAAVLHTGRLSQEHFRNCRASSRNGSHDRRG